MDLALNRNAAFTKWVVSAGLLTEPFVLIDGAGGSTFAGVPWVITCSSMASIPSRGWWNN
jgi:hypothetical protein